jgi:ribosome-associated protein
MRKVANFCDYFVICTGNTDRQVRAIALGIEESVEKLNLNPPRRQGLSDARWVVLDLGDVVVHVFEKLTREFYGLDYLWQEAKVVSYPKS